MRPFEIQIQLLSPIIMPRYPLSLDGLVYWALGDHVGHEQALATLRGLLAEESGCYKASSMALVRTPWRDITGTSLTFPTCVQFADTDLFADCGKKVVVTGGGPFRRRMSSWDAYSAHAVMFHGVGDGKAVAELIAGSVFGLGRNWGRGAGTIGAVASVDCESDFSWQDENGCLARTLPVTHGHALPGGSLGHARFRPPYMCSDKAECVIPPVFRPIYRDSLSV